MKFSEKIIKLRKENGLSQEEFGSKIGVSRQAVSKWEAEKAQPDIEKIKEISKTFNVGYDYLLDDEKDEEEILNNDNDFKPKINKKKIFKIILIVFITGILVYLGYGVYKYIWISRFYSIMMDDENHETSAISLYTIFEEYPLQNREGRVIHYSYVIEPVQMYVLYSGGTSLEKNVKNCIALYENSETNKAYYIVWDGEKYIQQTKEEWYGPSLDEENTEDVNLDAEAESKKYLWQEYSLIDIIKGCLDPRVVCGSDYIKYWFDESEYRIIELDYDGRIKSIQAYADDYTRMENIDYHYINVELQQKISKINTIEDFADVLGIELYVEQ